MKWKLIGGILIISMLLLFFNSNRLKTIDFSRYFSFHGIGRIVESMQNYIQNLINPGKKFEVVVELNFPSLYGKSIELSGSNLSIEGNCSDLEINGIKIERSENECKIKVNVENGNLKFDKVVEVSGTTNELLINEEKYVRKSMSFKMRVEPSSFFINNLKNMNMRLESATGEIRKYENGSLDQLKVVKNERVEIYNFFGSISLKNGIVTLVGTSTRICGENFDFRK